MRVIVIGTSQGGLAALRSLVGSLEAALPAAVLIVQHQSPDSPMVLADILTAVGPLAATYAVDGEALLPGHIYLATPRHHMLLEDAHVYVRAGPRENRMRPAIDPLFRSAAVAYGAGAIGVLLTGLLDDGVAGLHAIQRCGGVTIVQAPEEAEYPDMVNNALATVQVDYCLPLQGIALQLNQLAHEPVEKGAIPEDLRLEVAFSQRAMGGAELMDQIGQATSFTCPACGGRLWELESGEQPRYRCEVGHAYAAPGLILENHQAVERALWVAVRTLEERERMLKRMAATAQASGHAQSVAEYDARAAETKNHRHHLRHFLLDWLQASEQKDPR